MTTLKDLLPEDDTKELHELLQRAAVSADNGEPVTKFASDIGSRKGISGYSYHTVPCVLQAWFGEPGDFAQGLQAIIKAGGDTDTAGAIFGGIVGARVGREGIPETWLSNIVEWPKSVSWLERLGSAVDQVLTEEFVDRIREIVANGEVDLENGRLTIPALISA